MIAFLRYSEDDYAPYSPMDHCLVHGLEQVKGERVLRAGIDPVQVGVFACGAINTADVF